MKKTKTIMTDYLCPLNPCRYVKRKEKIQVIQWIIPNQFKMSANYK